jgi:predicted flap endonuclease-1-like 5' DNA nuclease
VVDAGLPAPRERAPREDGTPLPRTIGAPATRALREAGVATLEQVASYSAAQLAAMHGVGPIAITRLREALAEQGTGLAGN